MRMRAWSVTSLIRRMVSLWRGALHALLGEVAADYMGAPRPEEMRSFRRARRVAIRSLLMGVAVGLLVASLPLKSSTELPRAPAPYERFDVWTRLDLSHRIGAAGPVESRVAADGPAVALTLSTGLSHYSMILLDHHLAQ